MGFHVRDRATDQAVRRLTNPWVALFALLGVSVFNFADRYLITGLIGPIKAEFGVNDGYMGLLMGPAFVVLYVVAGVPIARLADRASRVKIIATGCAVWSVCTFATGFATGPVTLALARVGVGIGEAAFSAPAYSLVAAYFGLEKRGRAFATLGLATYIGQIGGQAGGPAIAAASDWRMAFMAMGAAGVVMGGLLLLLVREPPREGAVSAASAMPFVELIARLKGASSYLLMMIGFGFGTLSGVAFGYWGPELFARNYGVPVLEAKSAFAVNFALAGMIGMLAFGVVMDRLAVRSSALPVKMAAASLFAATACVLITTWAPSFAAAKLLAIPSGLLGGGWSIGLMTTLQALLPERFRASGTALFIMVTTLLGFLVGPLIAGTISNALGNDAQSLRVGLSVAIPFGFVAAALAWMAAGRIERDRERLWG